MPLSLHHTTTQSPLIQHTSPHLITTSNTLPLDSSTLTSPLPSHLSPHLITTPHTSHLPHGHSYTHLTPPITLVWYNFI
ncbi:hypothetical protein E2C01_063766 [Portunus trituberculatus]|uniref:Uncharacterized protein n=1 Tax=Portunus trituberculatus TaxID=210409 RepID=A0A5B7HLF0_PORTR|nr:hypothetical protein [Portunus trituberculatus]